MSISPDVLVRRSSHGWLLFESDLFHFPLKGSLLVDHSRESFGHDLLLAIGSAVHHSHMSSSSIPVSPRLESLAMGVKVVVVDHEECEGVTWYNLKVEENGRSWAAKRRYNQFVALEETLEAEYGRQLQRLPLPVKGALGLRHMANIGDFNQERQRGLQLYLEKLVSEVAVVDDIPSLSKFLSVEPYAWKEEKVSDNSAASNSKRVVAGAAAVGAVAGFCVPVVGGLVVAAVGAGAAAVATQNAGTMGVAARTIGSGTAKVAEKGADAVRHVRGSV